MKHVFIYGNIAKNSKVEYDPKTGECRVFKAKETTGDPDIAVVNMLKKFIAKNPTGSFTFILNRNLAVPVFQAMKVVNMLLLGKVTEDDEEQITVYAENLQNAGIDIKTINVENHDEVKNLIKVAMGNDWLDSEALDYMLDLFLVGDHKFLNIDSLIEEPREGAVLSQVSKYVREIALELVNKTCEIPVLARVVVEEDDEEEIA